MYLERKKKKARLDFFHFLETEFNCYHWLDFRSALKQGIQFKRLPS